MKNNTLTNMVSYAQQEMRSFDELPFNEIDSVILSWIIYMHFENSEAIRNSVDGLDIREIFHAESFDKMLVNVWTPEETISLLSAMVSSPRFRNIKLYYYTEELDVEKGTQFGAVTYRIKPDLYYVAFRGTDWSIVGWEEDFRLALKDPIPSQTKALNYLTYISRRLPGDIYVGGHSKGGNLAVYSAAYAERHIQDRILRVYSHDGPGFFKSELEYDGFMRLHGRIEKTLPKESFFGMIFEEESEVKVVDSVNIAMMQHNPMSWRVDIANSAFVTQTDISQTARMTCKRMNEWITKLSMDERQRFIDVLFGIFYKSGAKSFEEIGEDPKKYVPIVLKEIMEMDKETQSFMKKLLMLLIFGGSLEVEKKKEWKEKLDK